MQSTKVDFSIIRGDAVEVMRSMADESIDQVWTDPPYKLTQGGKNTPKTVNGIGKKHGYQNDGKPCGECDPCLWMPEAFRVLKDQSKIFVMADDRNDDMMKDAMLKAGFRFHRKFIWRKPNKIPTRQGMKNAEFIILGYKGKAEKFINPSVPQVIELEHDDRDGSHFAQKPSDLSATLIAASLERGKTVLDPFASSGAVGVGAMKAGCNFLGIEIDSECCNRAFSRLAGTLRVKSDQIDLEDFIAEAG